MVGGWLSIIIRKKIFIIISMAEWSEWEYDEDCIIKIVIDVFKTP